MKRSLVGMLVAVIMLAGVVAANASTVTLEWGTVAGADNYLVYKMPVGEQPVTNPPRTPALTVPATAGATSTGTVTIPAGAWSFFVTARNGWGESPPSNVVSTPPLPVAPGGLRVVVTVDVQVPQ